MLTNRRRSRRLEFDGDEKADNMTQAMFNVGSVADADADADSNADVRVSLRVDIGEHAGTTEKLFVLMWTQMEKGNQ